MKESRHRETTIAGGRLTHVDISYRGIVVYLLVGDSRWRVWWPTNASRSTVYQVIQDEVADDAPTVKYARECVEQDSSFDEVDDDPQDIGVRTVFPLKNGDTVVWTDVTEDRWITDSRPPFSVSVVGTATGTELVEELLVQLRARGVSRKTAEEIASLVSTHIERLN